ncbi:response regulator transcription factor [Blastococcus haudaquaticus]|uniref:response regulator transcription factor n=1 Tax=Blastococcus haudaquaticus TaxID=1938745 RepID=UPI00135CD009|nr:response regulator transcription factor [Blastococcus haudaquaticus]
MADEDPAARGFASSIAEPDVSVTLCENGAEALWHAGRVHPVLVILSATLPGVSAMDVAAVLTRHHDGVETIAVGVAFGEAESAGPVLAAGARHVVSRPYRPDEIQPLLRDHRQRIEREAAVLAVGALELNGPAFEVRAGGRLLPLTLREFEILRLLMLHADGVLSLDRMNEAIWRPRGEAVAANTVAVHIRHLRRHLEGVASIVAVRGVGYRLAVPEGGAARLADVGPSEWRPRLAATDVPGR